jgi:adenine-specific DNA-methyltransferase
MPMQKIETVDMPRSEALAGGQTTLGELKTTGRTTFAICSSGEITSW